MKRGMYVVYSRSLTQNVRLDKCYTANSTILVVKIITIIANNNNAFCVIESTENVMVYS